jgi:DNA helicase-2/ATP-dependent DNA helicase PcrA
VTIAPAILEHYPYLNDAQREVVAHVDGPLLVVAGPGSGKTYSIVLRALNLLLLEKAMAKEIVLCTFIEKAAFEMLDRLSAAAQTVGYRGDLSELRVTTIHGLCNRILTRHRHRTELGNSYETLDELTQLLFIFEHFDGVIGPEENGLYLGKWKTRWTAIEGARGYFDKITEELVDPARLSASPDPFTQGIARASRARTFATIVATSASCCANGTCPTREDSTMCASFSHSASVRGLKSPIEQMTRCRGPFFVATDFTKR